MTGDAITREGQALTGSLFNEPMRVETVRVGGDGAWTVGLVGAQSERRRKVILTRFILVWVTPGHPLFDAVRRLTFQSVQAPMKDPARFPWREVTKVAHYWFEVDAMTRPMRMREDQAHYGDAR